jgi:acetyl-CoA acyltransferase
VVPESRKAGPVRSWTDSRVGSVGVSSTFTQIGDEYVHPYGGAEFSLFAHINRKSEDLDAEPLAAYARGMSPK